MLNIGLYLRFNGPFLAVANSHGNVPAEVTDALPLRHRETRSLALVQKAHNEAHRKGAKDKSMHLENVTLKNNEENILNTMSYPNPSVIAHSVG